jgi:hypothetical protein
MSSLRLRDGSHRPATNSTTPKPLPKFGKPFTLLSRIAGEQGEWLWRDRIPAGDLTLFDGDPGTNKSSVALDLAARVSTGREMPDGTTGCQGGVVLLAGEDSLSKTIRPRLDAAGADLSRVAVPNDHRPLCRRVFDRCRLLLLGPGVLRL